MLRKVLATVLLLGALSGCTVPARTCTSDADCQSNGGDGLCDTQVKLCYAGNKEIDNSACTPACAPYEACTGAKVCVQRYSALVVTPGDGGLVGKGAVPVRAELVVDTTRFSANFPETLRFSAVREDGGTGGTFDAVSTNAGVYTTQWTPPAGDGVFLLTAAHPADGGPRTMVHLTVDATPPTFVVTVPVADAGVSTGGTTYAEPGQPNAWRRDQVLPVEIRTNEPNLDPASLAVTLRGTDGGFAPAIPVTPFASSQDCDAIFCGVAQLKLWEPPFNAFRGAMQIDVQGKDNAGNAGTASSSVNVTRWKWGFDASTGGTLIKTPAAIGEQGTIYFGTASGTGSAGMLFALRPDGNKQWGIDAGAVVSGPAIGASDAGVENIYVGINTSSTDAVLLAFNGSTGAERLRCPVSGQVASNVALTQMQVADAGVEVAAVVVNTSATEGSLRLVRPNTTATKCLGNEPISPSQVSGEALGSLVMQGQSAFFADDLAQVTSFRLNNNTVQAGWPVSTGLLVNGLAMVGSNVVGGNGGVTRNQGRVFSIATARDSSTPATLSWSYPQAANMRVFQPVAGSGDVVFFGTDNLPNAAAGLASVDLGGASLRASQPGAGVFKSAPALGQGGILYAAASEGAGSVGAWSTASLSNLWTLAGIIGPAAASPALDCVRDESGTPRGDQVGVLYVPAGGKLYAFVVDSPGLDPDAPWPKYQHDARNTGNPNTPISSCP